MRQITAAGPEALNLATELLHRVRLADRRSGLWEAADVQWWSRTPRRSDSLEQVFWIDRDGPVGGVLLTSWTDHRWQCDPVLVPHTPGPGPDVVWARLMQRVDAHVVGTLEVPVDDEDRAFTELALGSGLVADDEKYLFGWMDAADRPDAQPLPNGFSLVDRTQQPGGAHPMERRNGAGVEDRLRQCSLYDPELDFSVKTADGDVAGYSLYWFDPVTRVGLVEPMRVEDEHQRRGIARAMLTRGINRLVMKGAERIKVGFGSDSAVLYSDTGFRPLTSGTWYERRR